MCEGSHFQDPLTATVKEDQETYKKGGYVSDRTYELSMFCDLMMGLESGLDAQETMAA